MSKKISPFKRLKMEKMAWKSVTAFLTLVVVVGGVGIALAFNSDNFKGQVIEHVENFVVNNDAEENLVTKDELEEAVENVNFGAVASPIRHNQIECENDYCTAKVTVDNNESSSTIFSVYPPFRATTSTGGEVIVEYQTGNAATGGTGLTVPTTSLEMVAINVKTAATTTYSIYCGTAATAYATSTGALTILETPITVSSTPYMRNNMTAANSDGGILTGTVERVFVTPERPYVICKVNPSASDAFVDNPTFDADATFVFERLQR